MNIQEQLNDVILNLLKDVSSTYNIPLEELEIKYLSTPKKSNRTALPYKKQVTKLNMKIINTETGESIKPNVSSNILPIPTINVSNNEKDDIGFNNKVSQNELNYFFRNKNN